MTRLNIKSLVITMMLATSSYAADSSKIGVVNIDKVRLDTKAGKSIAQQVESLQNKFKEKVDKLQLDLDSKKTELDKQRAILSKEAFAKKETEFNNSLNESRKNIQKEAGELEQMQQPALDAFDKVALEVVTSISKENNYTQILPSAVIIYTDPANDITSQVIAGIDKKIQNIPVQKEAHK